MNRVELLTFENYMVQGTFPVIDQPFTNACWATVLTMLTNWKNKENLAIEAVLLPLDESYLKIFNRNEGLLSSQKEALLSSVGLIGEAPTNYSVEGILHLLKLYGLLWATTDEDPGKGFSIHARIIQGISGDGSIEGTVLHIVDPSGGKLVEEPFKVFTDKFEQEARDTGSADPLRIQMIHYP